MNTNTMELNLNEMEQAIGGVHVVDSAIAAYKSAKTDYERIASFTKLFVIPSFECTARAAGEFCSDTGSAAKNLGTAAVNWVKGWFD